MKSTFASQFKEYRKRLDISQEEIAERLNVTSQAVSKWECERSYPDMEMILEIASLFKISLDELLLGRNSASTINTLPNDDKLRVVLCRGSSVVDSKEADSAIRIKLDTKIDNI